MGQYFRINCGATLPTLRMELVNDGRFEFLKAGKFNNAIQNADVTFSMEDEHGVLKISESPCNIVLATEKSCEDRYIIEYKWQPRDTKKKGIFKGQFKIEFKGTVNENGEPVSDLYEEGATYPVGALIMPIYEDIYIHIK